MAQRTTTMHRFFYRRGVDWWCSSSPPDDEEGWRMVSRSVIPNYQRLSCSVFCFPTRASQHPLSQFLSSSQTDTAKEPGDSPTEARPTTWGGEWKEDDIHWLAGCGGGQESHPPQCQQSDPRIITFPFIILLLHNLFPCFTQPQRQIPPTSCSI